MSSLATLYPTFLTDVQAEIAKRGLLITDRLESGDSFDEVLEEVFRLRNLIQELENYFVTDHDVVDMNGNPWFSYQRYSCGKQPDHLIIADIQRIYREYCIKTYPGTLFPLAPVYITNGGWVGSGSGGGSCCGIPPYPTGANPGDYYLSYDHSTNSYVWSLSSAYMYRREFLWTSGPQEFTLNIAAEVIHFVFVNGQLIPDWTYELDGFVLTLLTPQIVLNSSNYPTRVIVYAGVRTVNSLVVEVGGFAAVKNAAGIIQFESLMDNSITFDGVGVDIVFDPLTNKITIDSSTILGGLLHKESFLWTSGGQSFTLADPAESIFLFFINGQLQGDSDVTHTPGTDVVTADDELEPDDEIVVVYTKTIA